MRFMRFELVENEEERKRLRYKRVFIDRVSSFIKKYFYQTFYGVDVNDMVIVINHKSQNMTKTGKLRQTVFLYDGVNFLYQLI